MQPSFWGPPIVNDTVTNMRRLQFLFGIHRDRFPKELRGRRMGKIIVYDWRAVVKIMDALLNEDADRAKDGCEGDCERCGSVIPIFVIGCSVE